jgi:hypothetical protein
MDDDLTIETLFFYLFFPPLCALALFNLTALFFCHRDTFGNAPLLCGAPYIFVNHIDIPQ